MAVWEEYIGKIINRLWTNDKLRTGMNNRLRETQNKHSDPFSILRTGKENCSMLILESFSSFCCLIWFQYVYVKKSTGRAEEKSLAFSSTAEYSKTTNKSVYFSQITKTLSGTFVSGRFHENKFMRKTCTILKILLYIYI